MSGTYNHILYHIVFSTKERIPVLEHEFRKELYKYFGGICIGEGCDLVAIGGTADHVHLLLRAKPIHKLSELMQKIKGNASKWANEKQFIKCRFAWQAGYGAFSVSISQMEKVILYIQNQEDHHRKRNFQEEFIDLLQKHRVEYNLEYLWK